MSNLVDKSCKCGKREFARGLCGGCYSRARRSGRLEVDGNPSLAVKHGHRRGAADGVRSRTYESWAGMVSRCTNPTAANYARYGARGIRVCPEWRDDFGAFLAHVGERSPGTTIDRIDVNGHYEPGNVRWATAKQQARNRTTNHRLTHNGVTKTISEWAESLGMRTSAIALRLRRGWSVADAVSTPRVPDAERLRRGHVTRGIKT